MINFQVGENSSDKPLDLVVDDIICVDDSDGNGDDVGLDDDDEDDDGDDVSETHEDSASDSSLKVKKLNKKVKKLDFESDGFDTDNIYDDYVSTGSHGHYVKVFNSYFIVLIREHQSGEKLAIEVGQKMKINFQPPQTVIKVLRHTLNFRTFQS